MVHNNNVINSTEGIHQQQQQNIIFPHASAFLIPLLTFNKYRDIKKFNANGKTIKKIDPVFNPYEPKVFQLVNKYKISPI